MRAVRAAVLVSAGLLAVGITFSSTGAAFVGSPTVARAGGRELGVARQVNSGSVDKGPIYQDLLIKSDAELHESIAAQKKGLFTFRVEKAGRRKPDVKDAQTQRYIIAAAKTILSARRNDAKEEEEEQPRRPMSEEWLPEQAKSAYERFAARPGLPFAREARSRFPPQSYQRRFDDSEAPEVPVKEALVRKVLEVTTRDRIKKDKWREFTILNCDGEKDPSKASEEQLEGFLRQIRNFKTWGRVAKMKKESVATAAFSESRPAAQSASSWVGAVGLAGGLLVAVAAGGRRRRSACLL